MKISLIIIRKSNPQPSRHSHTFLAMPYFHCLKLIKREDFVLERTQILIIKNFFHFIVYNPYQTSLIVVLVMCHLSFKLLTDNLKWEIISVQEYMVLLRYEVFLFWYLLFLKGQAWRCFFASILTITWLLTYPVSRCNPYIA